MQPTTAARKCAIPDIVVRDREVAGRLGVGRPIATGDSANRQVSAKDSHADWKHACQLKAARTDRVVGGHDCVLLILVVSVYHMA